MKAWWWLNDVPKHVAVRINNKTFCCVWLNIVSYRISCVTSVCQRRSNFSNSPTAAFYSKRHCYSVHYQNRQKLNILTLETAQHSTAHHQFRWRQGARRNSFAFIITHIFRLYKSRLTFPSNLQTPPTSHCLLSKNPPSTFPNFTAPNISSENS